MVSYVWDGTVAGYRLRLDLGAADWNGPIYDCNAKTGEFTPRPRLGGTVDWDEEYFENLAKVQDSYNTGAVRDRREGKGRYDLIPSRFMMRLAKHFEKGCELYGDNNWTQGMPQSRFYDSSQRHSHKYAAGWDDEDHLIAAAWNLICMVDQEERVDEGLLDPQLLDFPYEHNYHDE